MKSISNLMNLMLAATYKIFVPLILLFSTSYGYAAVVGDDFGKTITVERIDDSIQVGLLFYVFDLKGQQRAVVKITEVKEKVATAEIVSGDVNSGWELKPATDWEERQAQLERDRKKRTLHLADAESR